MQNLDTNEDGVFIRQYETASDYTLRFGPCEIQLWYLFDKGWKLSAFLSNRALRWNHKTVVYLERGTERYKLTKQRANVIHECGSLETFIKDGQVFGWNSYGSSEKPQVAQWDSILSSYKPVKRKLPDIGNMSFSQYVKSQLQ